MFGNHYRFFIQKEELARASAGCELDPSITRRGVERLFEEPLYTRDFPNSDPDYYLTRYWAMRAATKAASGYPERAYAKWLVLNFLWSQLSSVLRSRGKQQRFRALCERGDDVTAPLLKGSAFAWAFRFYRAERGKGARAIDVSSFFKRTDLDKQFACYWKAPPTPTGRPSTATSLASIGLSGRTEGSRRTEDAVAARRHLGGAEPVGCRGSHEGDFALGRAVCGSRGCRAPQ